MRRVLVRAGLWMALFVLPCGLPIGGSGAQQRAVDFLPRDIDVARLAPDDAARLGWSAAGIEAVIDSVRRLSSDSFIIATAGQIVVSVGKLDEPHAIHSARKAILSAVVGQHVGSNDQQISLDATLESLGIDDTPHPLSPLQKTATVRHLLKSSSGINHRAAAAEGQDADIDRRLGSEEHRPGTVWAYNNWDYNALTTIFEQRTGLTVAQAFWSGIAEPLGMANHTVALSSYMADSALSKHRAAMFRLSGREFGKLAQLYLDKGRSSDRQVIASSWIDRITDEQVATGIKGLRAGHGYLWWVPSEEETGLPLGTFFAWGFGNQAAFVIPKWDTIVVHQADTKEAIRRWFGLMGQGLESSAALEKLVVDCFRPDQVTSEFCIEHRLIGSREFARLIQKVVDARRR